MRTVATKLQSSLISPSSCEAERRQLLAQTPYQAASSSGLIHSRPLFGGGGHHSFHELIGDRRKGSVAVRRGSERFLEELLHARRAGRRDDDERPGWFRPFVLY